VVSQGAAVLALDVGTSSCRASLYDVHADPIPGRSARITYAPSVTPEGGAELYPEVLLEQVGATIDKVLAEVPPPL
jgi:gluconokinase